MLKPRTDTYSRIRRAGAYPHHSFSTNTMSSTNCPAKTDRLELGWPVESALKKSKELLRVIGLLLQSADLAGERRI